MEISRTGDSAVSRLYLSERSSLGFCASPPKESALDLVITKELYFTSEPHTIMGVEFDKTLAGFAGQVSKECEENGLLAMTAGVHEACRLIPPLIVSEADLDEGLSVFADAVKTVAERHGVASSGEPKPHTTGRPAVLRGLTGGSSFDGA